MFVNRSDGGALAKRGRYGGGGRRSTRLGAPRRYDRAAPPPRQVRRARTGGSDPAPARPPGTGWNGLTTTCFGEEGLRIAVEEWMPRKGAMILAEGWAGDSVALFRSPAAVAGTKATSAQSTSPNAASVKFAVAWHIRFDRDATGSRRRGLVAPSKLSRGLGFPNKGGESPSFCVQRTGVGPLAVARSGRDLMIVPGPTGAKGNRVDSGRKVSASSPLGGRGIGARAAEPWPDNSENT